ncbi:hypothetical protein BDN70DRAFT_874392 [Pholiota conissans]|uniref:F-box domain-containing protein n=1 Tax=Pholiota conissans TaxID=109636 RepID=A0A9P6CWI8_9AGAR|nr:hypothetical protein BDN70DRAFT_874392 [Pholiota conissans]
MTTTILTIAEETLIQIFRNLDAVSIARCGMTCKSINGIIKSSVLLTYVIQLYFDGLKDAGSFIKLDYSERTARLLRYRRYWMSPHRTVNVQSLVVHYPMKSWHLSDGFFASLRNDCLKYVQLPNSFNNKTCDATERTISEFPTSGFCMDSTQDLIAFLEDENIPQMGTVRIHLRSMSANGIHPLAQHAVIQFTILIHSIHDAYLEISENFLLLICNRYSPIPYRVLIWDWITGNFILDTLDSVNPLLPHLGTFYLLDSRSFLATTSDDNGSISLFKLVPSGNDTGYQVVHHTVLHLPLPIHGSFIDSFTVAYVPTNSFPNTFSAVNKEDRLHLFKIEYLYNAVSKFYPGPNSELMYFDLIVHQRVLTEFLSREAIEDGPPYDIPWEEWGPLNTRLIHCQPPNQLPSRYQIHGQRVVYAGSVAGHEDHLPMSLSRSVMILDFSLSAVLSARGVFPLLLPSPQNDSGALSLSNKIDASNVPIFAEDVETYLPCVTRTWYFDKSYMGYLINADGVIGARIDVGGDIHFDLYYV